MNKKLSKLYPLADQIGVSAFNFLLVFIPSLVLDTSEFVKFSNIALFVLFIINAANAVVYQPYLRFFRTSPLLNKNIQKNIYTSFMLLLTSFLILTFLLKQHFNFSWILITYSGAWIILMFVYELIKRYNMVTNKWNVNFHMVLVLNVLTFLGILLFQPSTAEQVLTIINCSLLILVASLLLINGRYFQFLYFRKDSGTIVSPKEFFLFGKNLLGGAIAFWFISGGYLLLIGHFINNSDIENTRIIQNFFSGSLIVINTLDNYLLAKTEKMGDIFNKYKRIRILLMVFLLVYSCGVELAIQIFYPANNIEILLVLLFALFYIILSNLRLINSIAKTIGSSKDVFISQFTASSIYLISIFIINSIDLKISIYILIFLWIPSLFIGYLYSVLNLRTIKKTNNVLLK
ncbi:hypothetical protein ACU5CE_04455 [Priestia megaterium]|uniref:hypothetical protein n=1 Tax=Priestia megaterium TaxID=1404 RepID=UPI00406BBDB0